MIQSNQNVHPENAFRPGQLVAVDVGDRTRPGSIFGYAVREARAYYRIRFLDDKPAPSADEFGDYWATAEELADLPADQRLALVGAPRLPGLGV